MKETECKTYGKDNCAYAQAQKYEIRVANFGGKSPIVKFMTFPYYFLIDTRRLILLKECRECKSCPHKIKT